MGHASVLEHVTLTYGVEGISRAASHRAGPPPHRLVFPAEPAVRRREVRVRHSPTVAASPDLLAGYVRHMAACSRLYAKLMKAGVPPEDARFALPNATETKILITMNARELHHFFALRTCRRAQWEIREMAKRMLSAARERAPLLFETAGPGCVRGRCPEGKMAAASRRRCAGRSRLSGRGRRLMPRNLRNSSSAVRRSSRA